jgi:hypothetical protein
LKEKDTGFFNIMRPKTIVEAATCRPLCQNYSSGGFWEMPPVPHNSHKMDITVEPTYLQIIIKIVIVIIIKIRVTVFNT